MRVTRCLDNNDGWERFSTAHPFLIKMCEVIPYGDPDYPLYNDNWPAQVKKNALTYLKGLESLEFIYCMVTLTHSLVYLRDAVVRIQGLDRILYQVSSVSSSMAQSRWPALFAI